MTTPAGQAAVFGDALSRQLQNEPCELPPLLELGGSEVAANNRFSPLGLRPKSDRHIPADPTVRAPQVKTVARSGFTLVPFWSERGIAKGRSWTATDHNAWHIPTCATPSMRTQP